MELRCTVWLLACRLLVLTTLAGNSFAAKPNIVFILADDLGYGDIGCYGGATATPHLDHLARQSVRFTSFYANGPECTPTRTALMTGRYQQRVGGLECALGTGNVGRYDDAIRLAGQHELGLPASETSIARLLKDAGYQTAIIGKWHLGYEPKFFPGPHGFDYWLGPIGGAADYFYHTEPEGLPALYLNGMPVEREGYMTDIITSEATNYIRQARGGPFFLYVAYTAPHTPIQGPNDRRNTPLPAGEWDKGSPATYAAMIRRLDEGVGQILSALDQRGLTNTLLVFTSDNGGTKMARNAPFSGTKGTLYEGGIREPCLVRWPGVLRGGMTTDRVGIMMDLTVSLARIGGARLPPGRAFDGVDLLQQVASDSPQIPRTLFWRARRADRTWRAVREGDLKYLQKQTGAEVEEHLFDLSKDLAEKNDLLRQNPQAVSRLKAALRQWEIEVRPLR